MARSPEDNELPDRRDRRDSARRDGDRRPMDRGDRSGRGGDRRQSLDKQRSSFSRQNRREGAASPRGGWGDSPRRRFGSPDRNRDHSDRARDRDKERDREMAADREEKRRSRFRFDSPPKDGEVQKEKNFDSGPLTLTSLHGASEAAGPGGVASKLSLLAAQAGLTADQIKAARELYVGNLPLQLEIHQLVEFVNAALMALKGNIMPGPPVAKVRGPPAKLGWKSNEGNFAFIEFRTMEEANNALVLNGLSCLGYELRIGRPKTYPALLHTLAGAQMTTLQCGLGNAVAQAAGAAALGGIGPEGAAAAALGSAGIVSSLASLTCSLGLKVPEVQCLLNMPSPDVMPKVRVFELLSTFGSLEMMEYVLYDTSATSMARRLRIPPEEARRYEDGLCPMPSHIGVFCLFAYTEPDDLKNCRDFVDGLTLGGSKQRSQIVKAEAAPTESPSVGAAMLNLLKEKGELSSALKRQARFEIPSRCLWMSNILSWEQVKDDGLYFSCVEDVELEVAEIAEALTIRMPRPIPGYSLDDQTEVGSAFLEFISVEDAIRVKKFLDGRRFDGRVVRVHFFSEKAFNDCDLKCPCPLLDPQGSSLFSETLRAEAEAKKKEREDAIAKKAAEEEERRRAAEMARKMAEAEAELAAAEQIAKKKAAMTAALADLGASGLTGLASEWPDSAVPALMAPPTLPSLPSATARPSIPAAPPGPPPTSSVSPLMSQHIVADDDDDMDMDE